MSWICTPVLAALPVGLLPPKASVAFCTPSATVMISLPPSRCMSAIESEGPSRWSGPRFRPFDAVAPSWTSLATVNFDVEALLCSSPPVVLTSYVLALTFTWNSPAASCDASAKT